MQTDELPRWFRTGPDDPGGASAPPVSPPALARLIDLAEDAIVSVDEDQRIVLFNRGAERTFGYAAAEVLGRPLDLLIPERHHARHRGDVDAFARSPADARSMCERRPVTGVRKDGTEFPAEVTVAKLRDGDRVVFNAIVRDVTDRVAAAEEITALNRDLEARVAARTAALEETTRQLWQAAKLATVEELAAGVAHELNNPLGTISLRLEGVLAGTPADDPRRPGLAVIEGEVERMARLVANLLAFGRRAPDQVSALDLADEARQATGLVEYHLRRRAVTPHFDVAPGLPPVLADRQKVRQVFLNLYSDAADAMPAGGTLTTRLYPAADHRAVVVEVADTGTGIPPGVLDRVFDPFFTTKEGEGTGLGLAICKRIVTDHKGTIAVDSAPGAGTTVRITLPVGGDAAR
jgi:PAS domain S-box-containing protein